MNTTPKTRRMPECGHPERLHAAKGLCKSCYIAKWMKENPNANSGNEWSRRNPKKAGINQRKAVLKKHGITLEEYGERWLSQRGKCANPRCSREFPLVVDDYRRGLQVDHDHATGIVRGLLCARCNVALGHAGDDCHKILGLIAYLQASGDLP